MTLISPITLIIFAAKEPTAQNIKKRNNEAIFRMAQEVKPQHT